MPAPKGTNFTPLARVIERWMKAHPGFMTTSEFAQIVELSPQIISEVFSQGKQLSEKSIRMIAEQTRSYDEMYPPEEGYVYGDAGIPISELMAARSTTKPDLYSSLVGLIAARDDLTQADRDHVIAVLKSAYEAYLAGETVGEKLRGRKQKSA